MTNELYDQIQHIWIKVGSNFPLIQTIFVSGPNLPKEDISNQKEKL